MQKIKIKRRVYVYQKIKANDEIIAGKRHFFSMPYVALIIQDLDEIYMLIGPRKLFALLKELKIIHMTENYPLPPYDKKGYFRTYDRIVPIGRREKIRHNKLYATRKGIQFIINRIKKYAEKREWTDHKEKPPQKKVVYYISLPLNKQLSCFQP